MAVVATLLLLLPGMCSGGRTQVLTAPVDPGGRIQRQNTVHRYSTTRRAQATASPITELLVGQSSSKCCSSIASASFQSSLVTRDSVKVNRMVIEYVKYMIYCAGKHYALISVCILFLRLLLSRK